jgi:hypothetical protein
MDLTEFKDEKSKWMREYLDDKQINTNIIASDTSVAIYEKGYSCLDLMEYVQESGKWSDAVKSNIMMCFNKIKAEFRCEKMLMMYMLNFIFLRENTELHKISFM